MGIYKEYHMTKQYACTKAVLGLFNPDIEAALFKIKMNFLESRYVFDTKRFDPLRVQKI